VLFLLPVCRDRTNEVAGAPTAQACKLTVVYSFIWEETTFSITINDYNTFTNLHTLGLCYVFTRRHQVIAANNGASSYVFKSLVDGAWPANLTLYSTHAWPPTHDWSSLVD
jgi:hypothetical protein